MKKLLLLVAFGLLPLQAWAQGVNGPVVLQAASTACATSTDCQRMGVEGYGSATVQLIVTGTATAVVEGSVNGTSFRTLSVSASDGSGNVTSVTATGMFYVNVGGLSQVRVRLSACTSCTVTSYIQGSPSGGGASGGGGAGGGDATAANQSTQITSLQILDDIAQAEDAVHSSGSSGVMALGVRNDAGSVLAADGDYIPLSIDSTGAVRVTGGGGGAQYTQDAALTIATTQGTMALGRGSAAAPTVVSASDDAVLPWYLLNGAQATVITAAGALIGGDATNGLDVDVTRVSGTVTTTGAGGTFPSTQSGTWTVQPGNTANTTAWLMAGGKTNNAAAPLATNVGALTALANASAPSWTEGNLVALSTDLAGALRVSGGGGGTQYTQDAALTVGSTVGTIAMGRASATVPTDVSAANDAVMPWYLLSGAVVTQPSYGGVVAVAGNGASGTGVQRVTIANDSTGIIALTTSSATIGALVANQSVNVAQINGVTPLMGAGNTGTGSARVTLSTDQAALPGLGIYVEDAAETAGGNLAMSGTVRRDTAASSAGTTGDNATLNTDALGKLWISGAYAEDAAHSSGDLGIQMLTKRTDSVAAPAGTDGDYQPLSTDASGRLWVNCSTGCSGGTQYTEDAASAGGETLTLAGAVRQNTLASSLSADGDYGYLKVDTLGSLYVNPFGATQAAATYLTVRLSDGTNFLTAAADQTEDAASAGAESGPMVLSRRIDTLASSAGTSGDFATFNTNASGALWTAPSASTNGGADGLKYTSVGSSEDKHVVKATAGTLYSITATNTNAAARYLRCENDTSGNTSPGSETPEIDLAIPGSTSGAGITFSFPVGYSFSTALTCWIVTGAADTDVAEVAANEAKIFYSFK